ncbi:MAG: hypothetical protein M1816_005494 [Peltula sp. TS41687]|nr:MAG: hypothetical protein M1816_005494 [Peltula sp. TS41687]
MSSKDECDHLASPSYTNFVLSVLILIGIVISYFPQHYRIVHRRSSEGLSPYFILLGSTAGTSAFANIILLHLVDLDCCRRVSGFECFAGILGIAQVGAQWLCFTIILLLYLIFFPRPTPPPPPAPSSNDDDSTTALSTNPPKHLLETPSTYRTAVMTATFYVLHAILTLFTTLILFARSPRSVPFVATLFGILAALLTAIQYFPQLHTTFRRQAVGSLSIPMMLIQTPGSFLWAATMAARMGWQGWSAWGIYVVSGSLQGSLLVMALVFEGRARRKDGMGGGGALFGGTRYGPRQRQHDAADTDDEGGHVVEGNHGERTALLGGRR